MMFNELLDLIRPYEMSGTLEDLTEAKSILDEHSEDKNLTEDEKRRIAEASSRLLSEMGDLMNV